MNPEFGLFFDGMIKKLCIQYDTNIIVGVFPPQNKSPKHYSWAYDLLIIYNDG